MILSAANSDIKSQLYCKYRYGKLTSCFISTFICSKYFTTFLYYCILPNHKKRIHILSQLNSGHITENQYHISHFSRLAHATEELKLGIIGADIKHPPMSTPIPIFIAPSAPPPAHPSNIQHVEFQTLSEQGRPCL